MMAFDLHLHASQGDWIVAVIDSGITGVQAMLLNEGDKILIAHRRLFERDAARFFIGCVDAYEAGIAKVTGHSYVRDPISGNMLEKAEPRTKIVALSSGTLIVYQLPMETVLEAITLTLEDGILWARDGAAFAMNLGEFTHHRGGV
jgi:hypothetical protein